MIGKLISKNVEGILFGIFVLAFLPIFFTLTLYFANFHGSLSSDQAVWGAFGDFFGGVVNPILSFMGLMALLLTIVIQVVELRATRKELEFTRAAHVESQKSLASQAVTLERQLAEAKKAANAEFFFKAIDLLQSDNMRRARRNLFELAIDNAIPFEKWTDEDIFNAENVGQCFDIVGMMVASGVIEEKLLLSSWQSPIIKSWKCLEDLALYRRSRDQKDIWDDFEWLYHKVQEYN